LFCTVEADGGWRGVSGAGVGGFFDAVFGVADAFDDAGVGAVSARWVQRAWCGQFSCGTGGRGFHLLRGKSARYRWRYGARS
jgi:hypothetical protein